MFAEGFYWCKEYRKNMAIVEQMAREWGRHGVYYVWIVHTPHVQNGITWSLVGAHDACAKRVSEYGDYRTRTEIHSLLV